MTHQEYIAKAIARLANHPWYTDASETELKEMAECEWNHLTALAEYNRKKGGIR